MKNNLQLRTKLSPSNSYEVIESNLQENLFQENLDKISPTKVIDLNVYSQLEVNCFWNTSTNSEPISGFSLMFHLMEGFPKNHLSFSLRAWWGKM